MNLKWDATITAGNVIELVVFLGFVVKAYGNWRILNNRIEVMWNDYCRRHHIEYQQEVSN